MASFCPHCGAQAPDEARFCMTCGRERTPEREPDVQGPSAPPAAPFGQPGQPPVPPLAPPAAPPPPAFAPGGPSPVGAYFGRAFRGDWAGSAQAALWPVGLLVIAAVALAIPSYGQGSDVVVGFGDRMRISLALLLQSLGGGFEVSASSGSSPFGGGDSPFGSGGGDMGAELSGGAALSLVPLTVTALWILALWIGVRVLRSRLRARAAVPDAHPTPVPGTPGLEAALRVALLVTVGVLVLGLFAQPSIQGVRISSSPVLAALGALLISLTVAAGMLHRDDLAQWLAARPGALALVRATGTALRALAVVLVICSLAAFIGIAQIDDLGDVSDVSDLGQADLSPLLLALLVLPNLGAMALGLGWGAPISFEAGGSSSYGGGYQHQSFGLSELGDVTNSWTVVGALALGTVCALTVGVMAARRSADRREQLLSAGIFLCLFLLLGALGGLGVQATGAASDLGGSGTGSAGVGLGMAEALLFGLLWVFAAAFLAPYLMQMAGARTGIVPEPQVPPGAFGSAPGVPAPVPAMPEAPAEPPAPNEPPAPTDPPSPAVAAALPTATAPPTPTPTPPPGPTPGPAAPAPVHDPHTFQLGVRPAAAPAKSPRRAGIWVATIAGAFVIGGGVAAGVLLLQDHGGKDDEAGRDDRPAVSTEQPATSQQPTPAPSPTPSATPDRATDPAPDASPDAGVPSGYRKVADPMGFSFVIPDVWSREGVENGSQITYAGSTGAEHYLIGVIPNAGYTSYDNILNMEKHAKEDKKKQDYQRIDLRRNTFQGRQGAIWEYTYRDEGGRTMHGIDQSYIAEDGTEYTIFLVGQQDVWADLKKTYRTGLESWRLTN
ncbi:zinc ribbon domain-containing protein [Streptomyces sp. NBC_01003]|uniref:zinc-ribbon domain-containing protein n=1 Tax=Streptomyces sp. NBC_01003 TaxID=2903714 RepID=UPI00386CBF39|nr:zinc ribbon domain-containing protein [Streptomyces sp. NBC_01003]